MTANSRRSAAEPPGLETQRREVESLLRECELRAGDSWYVVERRWFEQWKEFVETGDQNSSSFPGQIDNSELFEDLDSYHLKERLVENEDFVLLPAEAWHKLLAWYGMVDGHPPLERKVVDLPSTLKVEVYPVEIFLCLHSNMENVTTAQFSRTDSIQSIQRAMCRAFQVPPNSECRLWMKSSDSSCERLRNVHVSVLDACLSSGMTVIMETRNADGTWPSSRPQIMRNSVEDQDSYRGQPGVCGLTNLGNTCFMNSALQCLSNTPPLTEYFLLSSYLEELNFTNPLGMKGEIAEAYADVIKQMWSGRHYSVVPRVFKTKVGHFASQFLGYQQHDSQELLSFLLDGLHEDLNRVKNKEYIELRDAEGLDDSFLLIDTMINGPMGKAGVKCLCVFQMVVADVFNHRFYKIYHADESLSCILDRDDIFVYELSVLEEQQEQEQQQEEQQQEEQQEEQQQEEQQQEEQQQEQQEEQVLLALYLRERSHYRDYGSGSSSYGTSLFGHPLLLNVPRSSCSRDDLYNLFLQRLARYVRPPDPSEELEEEEEEDDDEEELYKTQTNGISDDEEQEDAERAGPSQTEPCSGDGSANSQPDDTASTEPRPAPNHTQPSLDQGDAAAANNGAPNQTELCSADGDGANSAADSANSDHVHRCDDDANATADSEPAAEPPQQPCETTEEEKEEDKQEEACSPSLPANEQPAKRRACRKRKKCLFTIQAVNSNGTTERGTGEGGSAVSFSSQPYVAIDWDPEMKKRFYNENEAEKYVKHSSMEVPQQQTTVQLAECIELFTTVETLEEENPWYCPVCKKHQLATKKLDLWSLPEVLIIHLKRFSYTKFTREKLDSIVEFPLRDLDFSGCLLRKSQSNGEPPSRYDLIAVSNHYGGLRDGHYTSYARNKDNSQWYYFDDSKVTYAREDQIVTNAAYVLFYHRQDKIRKPTLPAPNTSSASSTQPANDIASCKDDDAELGATSYVTMETD
ncbi:ubiquitin carboxyl-terminal hydrolase 11 [Thunnus thynnus]|uniref:ubiquitin carboxyl-terminal hydrolase 11 n=1 Tax=Thunnus thynnus TaxID=8237 RepID=UPI0035284835